MGDHQNMCPSRPGMKRKKTALGTLGDPRRLFLGQETPEEKAQHEAEDAAPEGTPGSVVEA